MVIAMRLDASRLRRELARRGLDQQTCASAARISAATMSAAAAGKPVRVGTARAIADALTRAPVIDELDVLLAEQAVKPE